MHKDEIMLTMKQNGEKIWVTFTVSPSKPTEDIAISGAWNAWEQEPMKKKKNGDYYLTKVLKPGHTFEFGYLLDGNEWITEEECTSVASPFGSHNSLLEL